MQTFTRTKLSVCAWICVWLAVVQSPAIAAPAVNEALSTDTISNAPIAETWRLLTTVEGYKALGLIAHVDLRLGGTVQIGEPAETSEVLAFDPEHMLALKPHATTSAWTVIYFTALGTDMTGVRIVRLGLADDAQLRVRLARADRELLDRLVNLNHPRCPRCEVPKAPLSK